MTTSRTSRTTHGSEDPRPIHYTHGASGVTIELRGTGATGLDYLEIHRHRGERQLTVYAVQKRHWEVQGAISTAMLGRDVTDPEAMIDKLWAHLDARFPDVFFWGDVRVSS